MEQPVPAFGELQSKVDGAALERAPVEHLPVLLEEPVEVVSKAAKAAKAHDSGSWTS